jgi:hypothetical protein
MADDFDDVLELLHGVFLLKAPRWRRGEMIAPPPPALKLIEWMLPIVSDYRSSGRALSQC